MTSILPDPAQLSTVDQSAPEPPMVEPWDCDECGCRYEITPSLVAQSTRPVYERDSYGYRCRVGSELVTLFYCAGCVVTCGGCNAVVVQSGAVTDVDDETRCTPCFRGDEGVMCDNCGDYYRYPRERDDVVTAEDSYGRWCCLSCAESYRTSWERCNDCGGWYAYGIDREYCSDCMPDECYDDCECENCNGGGYIRGYSYKPDPVFQGVGRVFLGMELELNTPRGRITECAQLASDYLNGVAYLKDDSSISHGFEMVTHPMTLDYASRQFPWRALERLASEGCSVDPWENGIHVHVNRSGFDGPAHIFRWLRMIYRNERDVTRIARRESSSWASFETRNSSVSRSKQHAKGFKGGDRYSAVNVQNDDTFEMRVFASSLNPAEVRAALELVAGTVEYTRTLSVADVVAGGWEWRSFIAWASERPEYAALVALNGKEEN